MKTQNTSLTQKERMANILFKIDAIKFGVFKLIKRKSKPLLHRPKSNPQLPRCFPRNLRILRPIHNQPNWTQKLRPNRSHTLSRNPLRIPNRLQPQKTLPLRAQRHPTARKRTQSRRNPSLQETKSC